MRDFEIGSSLVGNPDPAIVRILRRLDAMYLEQIATRECRLADLNTRLQDIFTSENTAISERRFRIFAP